MNFSLRERKGEGGEKGRRTKRKVALRRETRNEQGGEEGGEKKVDCKLERYKTGKLQTLRRVVAIF